MKPKLPLLLVLACTAFLILPGASPASTGGCEASGSQILKREHVSCSAAKKVLKEFLALKPIIPWFCNPKPSGGGSCTYVVAQPGKEPNFKYR